MLEFDLLEPRSLLSHFSPPVSTTGNHWAGQGGDPPTLFAVFSNRSPGPPVGGPNSSNQGDPFMRSGAPSSSTSPIPDEALLPPTFTASPVQSGTPAPESAAAASPLARSIGSTAGPAAAPSTKPAAVDETAITVAPVAAPGPTSPSAAAPGDDQFAGPPPGGAAGSARSAYVSAGLAGYTMLFTSPWGVRPTPVTRDPEMNSRPIAGSAEIDAIGRSAASALANLPAPRGAGLITDQSALRQGPIEECLTRVFSGLRRPSTHPPNDSSYLFQLALAVVALEMARRWRRRSPLLQRRSTRSRRFVINSLI